MKNIELLAVVNAFKNCGGEVIKSAAKPLPLVCTASFSQNTEPKYFRPSFYSCPYRIVSVYASVSITVKWCMVLQFFFQFLLYYLIPNFKG